MNISKLSKTESRQLLLIHTRLHYDRPDNVANMLKLIDAKGYFTTEAGEVYKNGLKNILSDRTPIDCIYCGGPLSEEDNLICPLCATALYNRVNDDNKDIRREKAAYKAAQAEAVKLARDLKNGTFEDDYEIQEYAGEHLERITAEGSYSVNGAGGGATGSRTDAKESPKYTGRDLDRTDGNEDKHIFRDFLAGHQKMIAIVLTLVIVLLMVSLVLLSIRNRNEDSYNIYEGAGLQGISDGSTANGGGSELTDGFELLGRRYTEVDDGYGSFEQLLSDNTLFYPECGVSIVFDKDTGNIFYMENDGTGKLSSSVPILGIVPGDSTVKAKKILEDNGLEAADISDNEFICQFGAAIDPKITYELSVSSYDGIIDLVCVRIIK